MIIYIIGSLFPVSYWGEDRIDIGCHAHTIAEWKERGREIGKENGFTETQLAEYERYILAIEALHAANPDSAKGTTAVEA